MEHDAGRPPARDRGRQSGRELGPVEPHPVDVHGDLGQAGDVERLGTGLAREDTKPRSATASAVARVQRFHGGVKTGRAAPSSSASRRRPASTSARCSAYDRAVPNSQRRPARSWSTCAKPCWWSRSAAPARPRSSAASAGDSAAGMTARSSGTPRERVEQREEPRVAPAGVVVAEAEHRRRPGGVERGVDRAQPGRHAPMTPASRRDDASNPRAVPCVGRDMRWRASLRTQSDERLVALARAGNEHAFEAIVERYRRPLLRHARRLLTASAAEDAVQQALLSSWTALRRGDDVRELSAWLHRILHNVALNALRDAGRGESWSWRIGDGRQHAEDEIERRMAMRRTLAGMAALPEHQREAVLRMAVEGRSQADVAQALGLSHGAVGAARATCSANAAGGSHHAHATGPPPMAFEPRERRAPAAARIAELAGGAGGGAVGLSRKAGGHRRRRRDRGDRACADRRRDESPRRARRSEPSSFSSSRSRPVAIAPGRAVRRSNRADAAAAKAAVRAQVTAGSGSSGSGSGGSGSSGSGSGGSESSGSGVGHERLRHQRVGHERVGHERLGHQRLGHQRLGHQRLRDQRLGHRRLRDQRLGHQRLGHQRLGHQRLGHQRSGLHHLRVERRRAAPAPHLGLQHLRIERLRIRRLRVERLRYKRA